MIKKIITGLCMICLCVGTWAKGQPGQPQVYLLDAGNLAANKKRISANDPQVMAAYKQLIKNADKGLQFGPVSVMEKKDVPPSGDKHDYMSLAPYFWPDPSKPDGLPYIRKDGETNPEVKEYKDKEYMPRVCNVAYELALAYYFSGNKGYAEHAAKLLRVWFLDEATRMNPNLNYAQAIKGVNDGRGAGLIDTRHFIKVIDAVGLLNGSGYWKEADQAGLKKWFAGFLDWMQTSKNGKNEMKAANNHGAWYDAQRLAYALYIDSARLAGSIVESAKERLEKQMDKNGFFPLELERTTSLHYTVFVMDAFFYIAKMAEKTGADLWNYTTPSGNSLKKGFETLRPYLAGEKQWEGPQIKPYDKEESLFILSEGYRFGCRRCQDDIKQLAGDKYPRLLLLLLNKN